MKQNYGAFIYEQKYNIINSLMKKDGMILLPIHYITKNNIKHLIVMLVKLQSHPDSKYSMTIEVYNAGF